MLVLFSGGRGSGKSTVAKNLYEILDYNNYQYVHQSKWLLEINNSYIKVFKILYFLTFFRFHVCGVFLKRFFRDLYKGRSKGSFGRIYMPCVFSYHLDRLKKNKEKCVIYESDFLTWGADKIIDGNFDPIEIKNYYSSVILSHVDKILIVICDTPIEEAYRRWCLRENIKLSSNQLHEWIEKRKIWKFAREKFIREISQISNIEILKLNGLDRPLKNATKIANSFKYQN